MLEIGTGCGYQTAILGEIAQCVYSLEIIPQLAEQARRTLNKLGYKNIKVKTGDGYHGWAENAPYDAIIVTAAPQQIPKPLIDQLAINGKMVIPVGTWGLTGLKEMWLGSVSNYVTHHAPCSVLIVRSDAED